MTAPSKPSPANTPLTGAVLMLVNAITWTMAGLGAVAASGGVRAGFLLMLMVVGTIICSRGLIDYRRNYGSWPDHWYGVLVQSVILTLLAGAASVCLTIVTYALILPGGWGSFLLAEWVMVHIVPAANNHLWLRTAFAVVLGGCGLAGTLLGIGWCVRSALRIKKRMAG